MCISVCACTLACSCAGLHVSVYMGITLFSVNKQKKNGGGGGGEGTKINKQNRHDTFLWNTCKQKLWHIYLKKSCTTAVFENLINSSDNKHPLVKITVNLQQITMWNMVPRNQVVKYNARQSTNQSLHSNVKQTCININTNFIRLVLSTISSNLLIPDWWKGNGQKQ